MRDVRKVFNGIKKRDDWEHFNWTITIKGVECNYNMGMGHFKIAMKKPVGYVQRTLSHPEIEKAFNRQEFYYSNTLFIRIPRVRDVLYSLASDASCSRESFKDFCSNLGYDEDSRKALSMYLSCQESEHKLRRMGYDVDRIMAWEL